MITTTHTKGGFTLIEDYTHTARCVAAIRRRRIDTSSAVMGRDGEWFPLLHGAFPLAPDSAPVTSPRVTQIAPGKDCAR